MFYKFLHFKIILWVGKRTSGVRQGYASFGIDWTFTSCLEDIDFADDISLLSRTQQHMHENNTLKEYRTGKSKEAQGYENEQHEHQQN